MTEASPSVRRSWLQHDSPGRGHDDGDGVDGLRRGRPAGRRACRRPRSLWPGGSRRAQPCGASRLPWPAHGRHVAVEFVHPVIVGKRALPAVGVEGPDPARALRLLARPGDVVLAVGAADDLATADLLRRARPGACTASGWEPGSGPRPAAPTRSCGASSSMPDRAAYSGDLVLSYHLLWELTHVVFEHPGLLAAPPPRRRGTGVRRVRHLLRRGPEWPKSGPCTRAAGRGRARGTDGDRRRDASSTRWSPATWCWCTPASPSPRRTDGGTSR